MHILDRIIAYKRKEIESKKLAFPLDLLKQSTYYSRSTASLTEALNESQTGIIAEHKRRSPSKSVINDTVDVDKVAVGYQNAGVCGMSVLTDTKFFGGSLSDLLLARSVVSFPLLRKEFIIDPYQIHEARAYGADAILLIAAILSEGQLKDFSKLAKSLQLDVLLEIHNEEELKRSLHSTVDMIGVNNRNLKTFEVSIETSKRLSQLIPKEFTKVSESGISTIETIRDLKSYGFQGFLIGENFMKTDDPGDAANEFIKQI